MSTTGRGVRRPGRRPGGADTKGEILSAARAEFAANGYDGASIRGIARVAGVDPALVHHYFGTKQQMFVAALALPFDPGRVVPDLLSGGTAEFGERLTRFFFSVWESPDSRERMLGVLRSAVTNEQVATAFRGFMTREMVAHGAAALDLPDAETRLELAVAQLIGIAVLRYVIKVEPLASIELEPLVSYLAPVLQRHLDGPAGA